MSIQKKERIIKQQNDVEAKYATQDEKGEWNTLSSKDKTSFATNAPL